ncbi:MAG: aminomethyl-transferring glycine dehydrogenase subunit GcvPA [Spirochaetes bacterium]|nr:aminomethyl-transferring glycine dehydrogenase subunit GcvPA [Spirochaetota bacterium]
MPYTNHSGDDVKEMLSYLGKSEIKDLFSSIPDKLKLKKKLAIRGPFSEKELISAVEDIASGIITFKEIFCGAGAYNHFIPASVDEITSRQEYYTAYTPYQPEVSQGSLQTMFEYQTMMAELTGLPVSNASMYDGASAAAEAALMAFRYNKRNRVLVSGGIHPDYLITINTYLKNTGITVQTIPLKNGITDIDALAGVDVSGVSSVIIQNPNFSGFIEDISAIKERTKDAALIYVTNEALSLAVLKTPADYGAAICCGDAQAFGQPLALGGPYLGFITCSKEFLHLLPGRIIGATVDRQGRQAFVMTLAAREQHIRRERATSNICSNHALCAVRAAVYLSLMGTKGLQSAAYLSVKNAHKLYDALLPLKNVEILHTGAAFFNEFPAKLKVDKKAFAGSLLKRNILGPLDISGHYLFAATEMNSDHGIELLIDAVKEAAE